MIGDYFIKICLIPKTSMSRIHNRKTDQTLAHINQTSPYSQGKNLDICLRSSFDILNSHLLHYPTNFIVRFYHATQKTHVNTYDTGHLSHQVTK